MDKIKTVKIKNEDGSISEESYTISVDARNVDMDNGKDLQDTVGNINIDIDGNITEQLKNLNNNTNNLNIDINKKPYYYNTVADMKADTKLKDGDVAITLGYYNINDKGGAIYKISNNTNQVGYKENIGTTLCAILVVNENTNILHYGAVNNDNSKGSKNIEAINNMISNQSKLIVPKGKYYTNDTIIINNINVDIIGEISYLGNEYAFLIRNMYYKNFNITKFSSSTGGFLKIQPQSGNDFIYNNFNLIHVECKLECLLLDASEKLISLINFSGNRIRSSNEIPIRMIITNGASGTYMNEINFIGLDIKAVNKKAVEAIVTGGNGAIGFKLLRCDLETSTGIHTKGDIRYITIDNCRLEEIALKNSWITIEDELPLITIMGEGTLYPKNIELINVSETKTFLLTNLTIFANSGGYTYRGGTLSLKQIGGLSAKSNMRKNITEDDLINGRTFDLSNQKYNDDQYNCLSCSLEKRVDIILPNTFNWQQFIFYNGAQGYTRVFKTGSHDGIISNMDIGYYLLFQYNNRFLYLKLEDPTY